MIHAIYITILLYLWAVGAYIVIGFRKTHPEIFKDKPPLKLWEVICWPFMWLMTIKEKEDE